MTHYGPEPLPDPTPPLTISEDWDYITDECARGACRLCECDWFCMCGCHVREPNDDQLPDPCSVAPWTRPIDKREMRRRE